MNSEARVRLDVVRKDSYWPDHLERPLPVTEAMPFWKSLRGWLIHRPRHGMIYLHSHHMSLTWLCGGQTNYPVAVKPECTEGLKPCAKCEAIHDARPHYETDDEEWMNAALGTPIHQAEPKRADH